MPRNGQGIYSAPPGTAAVPNTTISSTSYNSLRNDLVQDANDARPITSGGTSATTAAEAAKNLGVISARDLAGNLTVGGTANAITIVTDRVYTALTDSTYFSFKAAADIIAGGATINVDGLGAKKIRKVTADGDVDVDVGDILDGGIYTIRYDAEADSAAGAFIVVNSSNINIFSIGDFFDTARTLGSDWLRRDGALYDSEDYPDLAALLPELEDGVEWELVDANATGNAFGVVQAEDRIVAMFDTGSDTDVVASLSGGAWSVRATISTFNNPLIAYGASVFVAVDGNGKRSTSPDGDIWSSTAAIDTGAIGCLGIAFGASVFVAVGVRDDNGGGIWTSDDGATWTERTSGTSNILNGVDFVNNVFIATGMSGTILTSADGITWTPRTSGTSNALHGAAYAGSTYVVCGDSGTILTSANLTSWTTRTSGTSSALYSVVGNPLGFLVVGASGSARVSEDGITWVATPTGLTSLFRQAIYDSADDAKYYVVGNLTSILYGTRTLPTQFRVPSDDPDYGWIKATN